MKKIVLLIISFFSVSAFGQIIIGNSVGIASDKTSVLLEFSQENKGIVLPTVRTKPTNPTPGTIILDASGGPLAARVKYFNGEGADSEWVDLSGSGGNVSGILSTQPNPLKVQENSDAKVVIGDATSVADGVLVLESSNKAMVLPQVENVNLIPSPAPGMMVYVNKAGAKRLAVYNGSVWSFWAAVNE